MKIVALGHRRYVGKNTVGIMLIKACPQPTHLFSFAFALKNMAYELFNRWGMEVPEHYESHTDDKEKFLPDLKMTVREVWIRLGNEMRAYHPDVWVATVLAQCDRFRNTEDLCVITDLRYLNEVALVQDAGGQLVRIDRDCIPKYDDVADSALADFHGWNFVLPNHGDYMELTQNVSHMAIHLGLI